MHHLIGGDSCKFGTAESKARAQRQGCSVQAVGVVLACTAWGCAEPSTPEDRPLPHHGVYFSWSKLALFKADEGQTKRCWHVASAKALERHPSNLASATSKDAGKQTQTHLLGAHAREVTFCRPSEGGRIDFTNLSCIFVLALAYSVISGPAARSEKHAGSTVPRPQHGPAKLLRPYALLLCLLWHSRLGDEARCAALAPCKHASPNTRPTPRAMYPAGPTLDKGRQETTR